MKTAQPWQNRKTVINSNGNTQNYLGEKVGNLGPKILVNETMPRICQFRLDGDVTNSGKSFYVPL